MIKWEAVKPPATDEDIQRIESFVGQKLPNDYIDLVKLYQGCVAGAYFDVEGFEGDLFAFDLLLSVSKEEGDIRDWRHVMGAYQQMYFEEDSDSTLPKGFVPFALDAQNKWYCFDYRKSTKSPSIVLVNWEAEYEEDPDYVVTHIKNSFRELIQSLYYATF